MAKKKAARRRRPVAPGVDPNEKRRERLEQKRAERAAVVAAQKRVEQRARLVRWITIAAFFSLAVWFFWFRTQAPSAFNDHPIEKFSQAGVQQHTEDPVQYESTPPVAGAHTVNSAGCGLFAEQIPDGPFVHNLEHGAVGLQYLPTFDPAEIAKLEAIVGDYDSHTFSSPYDGMETNVAITAWGYVMRLDEVDEGAINDFIDEFRQQGPEEQDCPNASEAPFGTGAEATPSPAEITIPTEEEPEDGGGQGNKGNKKKGEG